MPKSTRSGVVLMFALVAMGCAGEAPTEITAPPPPPPSRPSADQRELQTEFGSVPPISFTGLSAFTNPRVKVTLGGIPVPGVVVYWSVMEGMVFPASSETDLHGVATIVNWRLSSRAGQQVLVAALGESESAKRVVMTTDVRARVSP